MESNLSDRIVIIAGPRQTGKSWWLGSQKPTQTYDLKNGLTLADASLRPSQIKEKLKQLDEVIAIEHIELLPGLLKEILPLNGEITGRLLLSTNNPQKIRHLLQRYLPPEQITTLATHPLNFSQLNVLPWEQRALMGSLAIVNADNDPLLCLQRYTHQDFMFEVLSSLSVRKPEIFLRMLKSLALSNGDIMNFEKLAQQARCNSRTLRAQLENLTDCFILHELPSLKLRSGDRHSLSNSRYYFYDSGVANCLAGRTQILSETPEAQKQISGLVINELIKYKKQKAKSLELHFWQDYLGNCVDLVINRKHGLLISSSKSLRQEDLSPLFLLDQKTGLKKKIVICDESDFCKIKDIEIWPVNLFLKNLWQDQFNFQS